MYVLVCYPAASGSDLTRFTFFVLRYELSLGERSLDPVLRVAAWSLNDSWPNKLAGYIYILSITLAINYPQIRYCLKWKPWPHLHPNCHCHGHHPPQSLPSQFTWFACKQVCYVGRWPSVGHDGEMLDAKRRQRAQDSMQNTFALGECRGDWKWHRELWLLTRNYKARAICHFCSANTRAGDSQNLDWMSLYFQNIG